MKEYNCTKWSEVPQYLKTKTSLNSMGIYNLSRVCAIVHIYNHTYNLYDLNECLSVERKRGNKTLMINSLTKSNYLILEMTTTGKNSTDEILELSIIDLDGKIKYQSSFNPSISKKYKYYFKTKKLLWKNEWKKISEILQEKIILVPNTIYAKRLINQTCEKYNLKKLDNLYLICSKPQIQHKLSILNILGRDRERDEKQENPNEMCFDFLRLVYPKSKIYFMQRKAEIYFQKLCEYKLKKGYQNAFIVGNTWLEKEYHDNNFSHFSYEICEDIINLIYPILKGLGILPKKIE